MENVIGKYQELSVFSASVFTGVMLLLFVVSNVVLDLLKSINNLETHTLIFPPAHIDSFFKRGLIYIIFLNNGVANAAKRLMSFCSVFAIAKPPAH